MKIWLDDVRPAPPGWTLARWPMDVLTYLAYATGNDVEEISLDHDLGDDGFALGTGYDVLTWIEEQVIHNQMKPPLIHIHTDNAPARLRMEAARQSIYRQHYVNLQKQLLKLREEQEVRETLHLDAMDKTWKLLDDSSIAYLRGKPI